MGGGVRKGVYGQRPAYVRAGDTERAFASVRVGRKQLYDVVASPSRTPPTKRGAVAKVRC